MMPRKDTAIADFHKCGGGQGANCCAYLLCGPRGFECGRTTELESTLRRRVEYGQMNAQRLPTAPFPACQTIEREGEAA